MQFPTVFTDIFPSPFLSFFLAVFFYFFMLLFKVKFNLCTRDFQPQREMWFTRWVYDGRTPLPPLLPFLLRSLLVVAVLSGSPCFTNWNLWACIRASKFIAKHLSLTGRCAGSPPLPLRSQVNFYSWQKCKLIETEPRCEKVISKFSKWQHIKIVSLLWVSCVILIKTVNTSERFFTHLQVRQTEAIILLRY